MKNKRSARAPRARKNKFVKKKITLKRPARERAHKPARGRMAAQEDSAPLTRTGQEQVKKAFQKLWSELFSSPVHLDSALFKQPKELKSVLARVVPPILLRPLSQAELLGLGVAPGEPWNLARAELAAWRPALLMAERMSESLGQPVESDPMEEDFPPAMISEWKAEWGGQTARQLVDALARPAPLSIRAARKTGARAVLASLKGDSALPVRAELSRISPCGVTLAGYASILGTELYRSGAFEIQDEGSQLMALFALWPERFGSVLSDAPGKARALAALPELPQNPPAWTVVDACAGAGGKTLALADALQGKGRVYAYDTGRTKLQALRRRVTRAGLTNVQSVEVIEGMESEVVRKFRRRAHVALVDAPCSGWGVLRRNPDIKWRQDREVLERMPQLQLRLLGEYAELVAHGGRLVYGVCTFRKAETRQVVERFLESHPDFEAEQGGYLGPGPCDGFFMQAFKRRS